jgi:hypothetical protein
MRVSKKQLHPVFSLSQTNFTKLHYNTTKGMVTSSQYTLHLSQHTSFIFERQQVLQPSKSCSPSSAANSMWHSTGPFHLHDGVLTGRLSKKQTGENLTMRGHCMVSVVTAHLNSVMSSAVLMALAMHTRVCLQPAVGMKQQHT